MRYSAARLRNCAALLFVLSPAANAQTLYQSGWEPAPALPSWSQGNVLGQSGNWRNYGSSAGHVIVGTDYFTGELVSPPDGSQMERSQTSTNAITLGQTKLRFTGPLITAAWAARAAGSNAVTVRSDIFVPAPVWNSPGLHCLGIWYEVPISGSTNVNIYPIAQAELNAGDQSLTLLTQNFTTNTPVSTAFASVFPYDTWFTLALTVDYDTHLVTVAVSGTSSAYIGSVVGTIPAPDDISLHNYSIPPPSATAAFSAAPLVSTVYTDNLSVDAGRGAVPIPGTGYVSGAIALDGVPDLAAVVTPLDPVSLDFRRNNTTSILFSRSVSLTPVVVSGAAPTGWFTLTDIPDGTYDIAIQGSKHLRTTLHNITVSGNTMLPAGIVLTGGNATYESSGDNIVDFDDFLVLLNAFGSKVSSPASGYDPAADFNYDGLVDFDDFLTLLNNFGVKGSL